MSLTVTECCRCCLIKEDDMVYVFDILDEFDSKICDLIESCGDVTITDDDPYSKHLCGNCLNDLANATRFRQRCHRTMDILLNMAIETKEPTLLENDQYQEEDTADSKNRLIEEIILEQVEEDTEVEEMIELPENQNSNDDFQSSSIQYIITEEPTAAELPSINGQDLAAHQLNHATKDRSLEFEDPSSSLTDDTEPKTKKCQNPKKNHPCSYCGKAFASNSALVAHIRVHTQERPFPCSYCQKRFRTVGALELHERRHSGVKPYKCDFCGKGFAESSNLKVHRRIHTQEKPHVCTICNRAFSRVFLLQIHQRTHTGERPFSCEECGKPFNQQGDLAAHRRTHTGERPHQCNVCGKGFIKSSGLTLHRKKHELQGLPTEKLHMVWIDAKEYDFPASESNAVDMSGDDMVEEDVIVPR
ncbi:hypothetical protein RP20_CCG001601 [Aedes albopictus]|nr:hypothetical protein RP20_CCG001601 [Aedes albopictus]